MRWMLPAAAMLSMLLAVPAHAGGAATVYRGTLAGAGEVVLELTPAEAPGQFIGRYFYPRFGIDIPLSGGVDALVEPTALAELGDDERASGERSQPRFDRPAATWRGAISAGHYRGQWTDARSGRTRAFDLEQVATFDPVALTPGAVEAVSSSIAGGQGSGIGYGVAITARAAPYEYAKLAGHAVAVGTDVGSATVAYRMWSDPRTKLRYPRLSRHPDAAVMARVNSVLEQRHWQMSLAALECRATRYTDDGPSAGSLGSYDDEFITVPYLSTALMTVVASGSLYCGGAHPDNHRDPHTLDLLRGDDLDFNRLFDAYVPGEYHMATESPALVAFVDRVRRDRRYVDPGEPVFDGTADSADADDVSCIGLWPEYLALSFETPGALSLSISGIGHALGMCLGVHARVPFADLTPILRPGASRYLTPPSVIAPAEPAR